MVSLLHDSWNRKDIAFNGNGELVYNRTDLDHLPYLKAVFYCLPYNFEKIDRKEVKIDRKEAKIDRKEVKIDRKEVKIDRKEAKIDKRPLNIYNENYDDYELISSKPVKKSVNRKRKHNQRGSKKKLSKFLYNERKIDPDSLSCDYEYDNIIYTTTVGHHGYECEDYCCTYHRDNYDPYRGYDDFCYSYCGPTCPSCNRDYKLFH